MLLHSGLMRQNRVILNNYHMNGGFSQTSKTLNFYAVVAMFPILDKAHLDT